MIIKNASFIRSVLNKSDYPTDGLFEIALVGRSNSGKSTFINTLCNNKKLARTSKTPGKTITLNYYLINKEFYFVDFPGYGYARRNDEVQTKYSSFIESYFASRSELKRVLVIVDAFVQTKDDYEMIKFLKDSNIPFIVIFNKIDKLKRNDIVKNLNNFINITNISKDRVICFSSMSKENIDNVLSSLDI